MPIEDDETRIEFFPCGRCRTPVAMEWSYREGKCLGYNSSRYYVVIADGVFHSDCWDTIVKENPIT